MLLTGHRPISIQPLLRSGAILCMGSSTPRQFYILPLGWFYKIEYKKVSISYLLYFAYHDILNLMHSLYKFTIKVAYCQE